MNKGPLISVIITSFNSEKFIEKSITSVMNQTFNNFELIVVDDCSKDKTIKILNILKKKFSFKTISLKKNSGTPGKPRNIGIKNCKGKLVAFLDADDYWHEDKLKYQVKYYKKGYINCLNTIYFNKQNIKSPLLINLIRKLLINFFSSLINYKKSLIFFFNPIILSSVLIDKSILIKTKFSENKSIAGIEDLLLWFKIISEQKYKINFLNKTLVCNYRSQDTLHGDYFFQIIKSINIISGLKLDHKLGASNLIIILSIFTKLIREILKFSIVRLIKYKKIILTCLLISYFLIFYSPFFNILGKPLLYFDESKNLNLKSDLIVVNTNYGYDENYNFGFNYRLEDLTKNFNEFNSKNILLLGDEEFIPQKMILKGLLIKNGFKSDKIIIVLNKLNSKKDEILFLNEYSSENNIKNISYFTSPYNTKLSKKVSDLYKNKNLNFKILKSSDLPKKKHPFFKRFSYKKMIIVEYLKLVSLKISTFFLNFIKK